MLWLQINKYINIIEKKKNKKRPLQMFLLMRKQNQLIDIHRRVTMYGGVNSSNY